VLTLGGPLHEHEHGAIHGVVAVGPHECMPNKIAEAQFAHIGQDHGLLTLALPFTGDPIDPELLDRFAFDVQRRFRTREPTTTGVGDGHGGSRGGNGHGSNGHGSNGQGSNGVSTGALGHTLGAFLDAARAAHHWVPLSAVGRRR
jgi:hypothetical protein